MGISALMDGTTDLAMASRRIKFNEKMKMKKVLAFSGILCYNTQAVRERQRKYPGVAKFGIALEWGSRGRWFESSHSDHAECPYRI